jgi:ABC-type sulfate transport system permease subunit
MLDMLKNIAVYDKIALENSLEVKKGMHGGPVFLAFFVLFAAASYAVPVPLFPGSYVPLLGIVDIPSTYAPLVSAVVNGLVYGTVVWLVFILASRRLEEPKVRQIAKKPQQRKRR